MTTHTPTLGPDSVANTLAIQQACDAVQAGDTVLLSAGEWVCALGTPGTDPALREYRAGKSFTAPWQVQAAGVTVQLAAGCHLRVQCSHVPAVEAEKIVLFVLARFGSAPGARAADGCRLRGEGYSSRVTVEAALVEGDAYNGIQFVEGTGTGQSVEDIRVDGCPNGGHLGGEDPALALATVRRVYATDWPGQAHDLWWRLDGHSTYERGILHGRGTGLPGQGFYTALDRPFHCIENVSFRDLWYDRPIDLRGSSGAAHSDCTVRGCLFENCSYSALGANTGAAYDRIQWLDNRCVGGDGGIRAQNVRGLTVTGQFVGGRVELRGCRDVRLDVGIERGQFLLDGDAAGRDCREISGVVRLRGAPDPAPTTGNIVQIKSCIGGRLVLLASELSTDDELRWMRIVQGGGLSVRGLEISGDIEMAAGSAAPKPLIMCGPAQDVAFRQLGLRCPSRGAVGILLGASGSQPTDTAAVEGCDFSVQQLAKTSGHWTGTLVTRNNRAV